MYKLAYVLSLCFLAGFVNSSCVISSKATGDEINDVRNFSERVFTSEEMAYLKNSTTLFVIPESELDTKDLLEEAITSTWNLTDLKFITYDDLINYQDRNYSYFIVEGYNTHVQTQSLSYDIPHVFLTLKYTYGTLYKKGKKIEKNINYCRIELFPDPKTLKFVMKTKKEEVFEKLYMEGVFKNWSPGMIQLYVQDVQQQLRNSKRAYLFESIKNEEALGRLKRDTLYVPEHILIKFNPMNGNETIRDEQVLFDKYTFPYKIVPTEELSQKIVDKKINYVLDYVKSSADNYVRVYNVQQGRIYQLYKSRSYNIKSKDIMKIIE